MHDKLEGRQRDSEVGSFHAESAGVRLKIAEVDGDTTSASGAHEWSGVPRVEPFTYTRWGKVFWCGELELEQVSDSVLDYLFNIMP